MFISSNFTFNNESSSLRNVHLVTFDSDVLSSIGVAFNRSVTSSEGYSHLNPSYKVDDIEVDDVILNLAYIDEYGTVQEWTEDKILDVKKWLITDNFAPFVSEDNLDYVYYFMCTKIEKKMTPYMCGVLEVTFKVFSHFAYKVYNNSINVTSSTDISIDNPSIYSYNPVIRIKNKGTTDTINKICDLEIRGLETNEIIVIDNLMMTVTTVDGLNKFANCNRNWLELKSGLNKITLSGNCEVKILCEFPILL